MIRAYIYFGMCFILLAPLAAYPAQEVKPIRFGSVAEDIPTVMHQRLIPLTDYLGAAIGRQITLVFSPDMASATEALSSGNVELSYLTPAAYLRAQKAGNVQIMAKVVTDNQPFFRLEIVVREDSSIQAVADLAGKKFAFGDPAALLQRAVVVNAGMPLENLGSRDFVGHHDNVSRGVLNRDYDAGIVTDRQARKWANKGLRVIYSSPPLPPFNISATRSMDPEIFLRLQKALLSLDRNNPDHRRVLDALGANFDGFTQTNDAEYDIVRKLTKPFQP